MNPQRKPAQSRPTEKAAAGGMDARQVGSPAGGRRTAAMFSSLGVAANNSIRSRNRHLASRAVRRLGFAPIPGRRSNSAPHAGSLGAGRYFTGKHSTRPALPLASGDALCTARVGHSGIDAAREHPTKILIGGVQ